MAWSGDDFERPIDDFGRMQAEAIGTALAGRPIERILSSPAVRCVDTVVPLGRALGLPVETADELAEGSHVADAFELLRSLAAAEGDSVLCSHGDVIPGCCGFWPSAGWTYPNWVGARRARSGSFR